MNSIFTFVILIILIILVGFFTSSETAYLSLPKLKVRSMVEERKPYAKIVYKLKSNMDKLNMDDLMNIFGKYGISSLDTSAPDEALIELSKLI